MSQKLPAKKDDAIIGQMNRRAVDLLREASSHAIKDQMTIDTRLAVFANVVKWIAVRNRIKIEDEDDGPASLDAIKRQLTGQTDKREGGEPAAPALPRLSDESLGVRQRDGAGSGGNGERAPGTFAALVGSERSVRAALLNREQPGSDEDPDDSDI
jgi:hypothetical protein